MIILSVHEYCHNCPNFEAEVMQENYEYSAAFGPRCKKYSHTITCVHEQRCETMMDYLKSGMSSFKEEHDAAKG